MASLRHMPPPGGDKASGLDGDLQGRRLREDGTPRGRREGQDPLSRRRSRAWVAGLVILVLVAAAVVGILYPVPLPAEHICAGLGEDIGCLDSGAEGR